MYSTNVTEAIRDMTANLLLEQSLILYLTFPYVILKCEKGLQKVNKIPKEIFDYIENYIPFSSVDILINYKGEGIILTKRTIHPYRGWWHLPGSVILKNEKIVDTVKRSAREELGIQLAKIQFLGNYELFTKHRHYITHTFIAEYKSGKIKLDEQSSAISVVNPRQIPKNTIPIQKLMIQDALNAKILLDQN